MCAAERVSVGDAEQAVDHSSSVCVCVLVYRELSCALPNKIKRVFISSGEFSGTDPVPPGFFCFVFFVSCVRQCVGELCACKHK